jgi:plasmid maintenance system antidote protein VapI
MNKENYNGLLEKHGAAELANNFVFPVKLSKKEQVQADKELKTVLQESRASISKEDMLRLNLLQLRFQIEDYVNNKHFDKHKTFGHFLKIYITGLNKKRNEFAKEIHIKPTELSQYINNHRIPPKNVMIRLELHSHMIIPATDWYRLLEKETLHELGNNRTLRAEQRQFVTRVADLA